MSSRFDLHGRVALVTGSSRGIGHAVALGLAEAGAAVAFHASRDKAHAEVAAHAAAGFGGRTAALAADIGSPEACRRLVAETEQALGAIDILVLNASFEERCDWDDIDVAYIERHVATNFTATITLLQAVLPAMKQRGWGRVVTMGSIQEAKPNPRLVVYAALKSAQTNLVRNLARQVGTSGLTLNNIAPGAIETDRNRAVLADDAYRARVASQIPGGRVGRADDLVGACLLLCSDAGSYINGVTLNVDGGWHAT